QRRYVPGTMVLETTWHTPTGWCTVHDVLVVGPIGSDARDAKYRRVPGNLVGRGTLLRVASCATGRVELEVDCMPLFDYGRAESTWEYEGDTYDVLGTKAGDLHLRLSGTIRIGTVGARAGGRATLNEGESAFVALSWGEHAPTSTDEANAQLWTTQDFWR